MSFISNLFTPDYERYEGVRPVNIYLLRLLYFLMAAFVATDAWMTIIKHQGPWDRFMAHHRRLPALARERTLGLTRGADDQGVPLAPTGDHRRSVGIRVSELCEMVEDTIAHFANIMIKFG